MRYEKPTVMDLSAQARSTIGQWPLQCMAGISATGLDEWCVAGPVASIEVPPNCGAGGDPGPNWCGTGGAPLWNACVSGPAVTGPFVGCDFGGAPNAPGPGVCNVGSLPT